MHAYIVNLRFSGETTVRVISNSSEEAADTARNIVLGSIDIFDFTTFDNATVTSVRREE